VNVVLYAIVFYEAKLYADMGLQVVYAALSVYGWYAWIRGGTGGGALEVSKSPRRELLISIVAAAAFAVILGTLLRRATDAALPYIDSTLTSFSLAAQWLMTRKLLENWVIWASVDVVYVGMFYFKALYLTSALYAVFLVLALLGYREWKRALVLRPA